MNSTALLPVLLLLPMLVACGRGSDVVVDPVTGGYPVVRTGTSFGQCVGYCRTDILVDSTHVVMTRSGGGRGSSQNLPDSIIAATISWNEWADVVDAVDMAALARLDSVIGCPDCADGGAEWIEVRIGDRVERVTFPYGDMIPEIRSLLEKVRTIRERMLQ